jgi:hypothetical protein
MGQFHYVRNQSHASRTLAIELSKAGLSIRVAGTHPTDRWSTSGESRRPAGLPVWSLKVVMEIMSVLMVATAGLLLAHFVAIVKRFIAER